MRRNSVKYVLWKDDMPVTAGLKRIYQSVTEEEALLALNQFSGKWECEACPWGMTNRLRLAVAGIATGKT